MKINDSQTSNQRGMILVFNLMNRERQHYWKAVLGPHGSQIFVDVAFPVNKPLKPGRVVCQVILL